MSAFIYKLNAMENAASSGSPADNNYYVKRLAVLSYVSHLELSRNELLSALKTIADSLEKQRRRSTRPALCVLSEWETIARDAITKTTSSNTTKEQS